MMEFKLVFSLIFIIELVNGDVIIQTESGPIRGKNVGKVDAFLGIPYAEPPLGNLRFAKPVPTKWSQIYEATSLPPPCIQMDIKNVLPETLEDQFTDYAPDVSKMTEDCLYLNVWVPVKRGQDQLKAVMLFIHGGGFIGGSTSMAVYDGAKLAEYGDVVVVTINYRVGAFGFFTGLTENAPGSQGLYDQVLALQWIKDNANHFGGDPDNIVLFGESAGAFSVSMHQISPLSKNLFKRAILQSGSSINPDYTKENKKIREISNYYADMLGCTKEGGNWFDNPSDTINCLRNVPAEKFPEIDLELLKTGSFLLLPTIGNDFLPENPIEMFRNGQFKDSEVLMGITKDEGSSFIMMWATDLSGIFGNNSIEDIFNETTAYNAIKSMMGDRNFDEDHKIIQRYLGDVNDDKLYMNVVAEAAGDIIITCGNIFQAEYQSWRENPVYFYMFSYRRASSPFPEWMGVPHFDEVQFIFGNSMFGPFTEHDEELSRDIIDMWTTFAKTGNPTIPGSIPWPLYSYESPKYLKIGKRDKIGTRPDNNRCERLRNRFRSAIDESVIKTLKVN